MRLRLWVLLGLLLAGCRTADQVLGVPATEGYGLRFEGNGALTSRSLAKAIRLELDDWRNADYSRAYADDAAYSLRQHYAEQGYASAQVQFEVQEQRSEPRLVFRIEEGTRTLIDGFDIEGFPPQEDLDLSQLEDFYSAPRSGLAGIGKPVYVESKVRSWVRTLVGELRARGYLDAEASDPRTSFSDEDGRARVAVSLIPGPIFTVREIQLDGLEEVGARVDGEAVAASLWPDPDRPRLFIPRLVPELRGKLLSALQEEGYADATVDVRPKVERQAGAVELVARIRPGPRVRVGRIEVLGRSVGNGHFVRGRMLLEPGDVVRASLLRTSTSRLYRSGLFRRVEIELEGQGSERNLVVKVEERPSRELFVEPGYGSYELLRLRAGLRERDLFGTGRGLRAEVTAAIRAQHALVGLSDPELLGPRDSGDLTVDYDRREQPSFTSVSRGVGLLLTHDWKASGRLATTYGYQYRQSDLEDVEVVTSEVEDALEELQLSGLRISHLDDRRDLPLFPRSGSLLQLTSEWGDAALGSDLDYVRLTASAARYWAWGEDRVVAAGLRAGTVRSTDGSQVVPLQERFFLGGENSVRSYRESELGPTDSEDNPVGGEAFTFGSLEVRQDLGTGAWQMAGFVDLGNVTPRASDVLDLDGYGWGVGLGLRYLLPVGPVRLDLGWNPDAASAEDSLVLHLAVGLAF